MYYTKGIRICERPTLFVRDTDSTKHTSATSIPKQIQQKIEPEMTSPVSHPTGQNMDSEDLLEGCTSIPASTAEEVSPGGLTIVKAHPRAGRHSPLAEYSLTRVLIRSTPDGDDWEIGLDSGCTTIVVSEVFALAMEDVTIDYSQYHSAKTNGGDVQLTGKASFSFYIPGEINGQPVVGKIRVQAWILQDLESRMLLGNQFLHRHQAVLDFELGKLILKACGGLVAPIWVKNRRRGIHSDALEANSNPPHFEGEARNLEGGILEGSVVDSETPNTTATALPTKEKPTLPTLPLDVLHCNTDSDLQHLPSLEAEEEEELENEEIDEKMDDLKLEFEEMVLQEAS